MARRIPTVTLAALFLTGMMTALQFRFPGLIAALERTQGMLASGQWWRLITPILINPESWSQIAVNFSGIAIVGFLVERIFGSARWLILYLTGALVGELAGAAWKPLSAGSSVAICGLLGGLATWLLWRRRPLQSLFGGIVILLGALVLTGMRDLHGPPLLAGALAAAVMLSREAPRASGT